MVNRATLTVTASNATRSYGQTNPPLWFSISGFKNGEGTNVLTSQPTISTTAATNSAAGTYPITVTGGSATNYSFAYTNGALTVTSANQT
ncbi:MAG: peptidase C10 family protein, partial [Verrucomicrobia bacterium]|nr:peptidase C10 family protein [Verrucomicrobiota bacterium]